MSTPHRIPNVRARLFSSLAFLFASCSTGPKAPPAPLIEAGVPTAAAAAPATAPSHHTPTSAPANDPGYRTAFDLYTNRVQASVYRDKRLIVDAGSPDFLKYVDGGWKTSWVLGADDQGKPAALVSGLSSLLFLPADADGGAAPSDATLSFTMRALAPKQRVSIFVNEKPAGTLEVTDLYSRHEVAVPAALLHAGDNRVRLTFKSAATLPGGRRAAALRSVSFGPAPAADLPGPAVTARDVDLGGAHRRALVPAAGAQGSRLSFFVQLPPAEQAPRVAVSYGADKPGAGVAVWVTVDGQKGRTLHESRVAAGGAWTDVALDLGPAAGQAARIDLVATGGDVSWGEPRVTVKAPPPPTPATAAMPRFDHIYVWMVDTLRADKVGAWNPKTRVRTPNYDAFAADATRFEWAQVPGTWSLPSHASLLTGVYPTNHRATAHEAKLSRDVPFVAEEMKKAGYKTAMFSSNGYVSSKWGFDRGWDVNRNFIRESLPNGAEYLWKTAKAWISPPANLAKRQFVYLATVEPHVIYNPRKEFLAKYWDKPYSGPIKPALSGVQLGSIKSGKLKVNDNDKAYLEALHDAEITQSDAAFKTFIDDLKALGIYETSAVIVVSDHGDQFYEHGSVGHGDTVYQELTHVPLIIRAPGLFPKGHVVHSDVEIMDVYATMLDLAGIKPGPNVQGVSLAPLAVDEVGQSPRAALTIDGQVSRGLKVQRYRLVHHGPGRIELYDELADPREQKNVAADRPIALRQMRSVLGLLYAYESKWVKGTWGTAANVTEAFNASGAKPGRPAVEPKSGGPA